jgi:hypothetical protein
MQCGLGESGFVLHRVLNIDFLHGRDALDEAAFSIGPKALLLYLLYPRDTC